MKFARPINDSSPNVTQPFGGGHAGVDYGYPDGTPIYASQSGRVTIAKSNENRQWIANTASDPYKPASGTRALRTEDYGNFVKIDHGEGMTTLYAHQRPGSLRVKTGQSVTQGQQIGEVGSTGNSTGHHLHWELRQNEKAVDPAAYLDPNFSQYAVGEVNPPMADNSKITIEKELFEELVGKASKYDGFFNAGYSDVKVVTRRLNEADRDLAAEREKVASLEQQLKDAQKPSSAPPPVTVPGDTVHIPEGGSQEEYDYWKKVAWRFLRTGVASGVSTAALVTVAPVTDLSSVQTAAMALGMAFFSGFISAAGMMVRDSLSGGDMTARSQKLPV